MPDDSPPERSKVHRLMNRWDLFALAIPILGLAPLLYVEAYQVWQWRHMQFAPLMLVIAAVTCFRHRGSALAGDWRRVWFAIGVWVAASLVGVAAMFWYSPWLAHCAAIMVFGGWALGRFGEVTWSKVAAWTAMLVITAPLPLNLDQMLIQKLQLTSSIACSSALDGLQVSHLRAGNVLSVRGQDLFVEEACSGVGSLYALAAITIVLLALNQRSLWIALLVLPTVLVWAGVGNFLRLVAIAVGLDWYGRDLSTGYDHELLGIVTFGISAIGLWATEWFVASLLEPFQLAKLRDSAAWREEALPLYLRVNRLLDWPGDGSRFGLESPEEPREPPASNWERRPAILVMGVIVSVFFTVCGGVTLYATSTSLGAVVTNYPALAKEPYRSKSPSEEALPAKLGVWERKRYEQVTRDSSSNFGAASNMWYYRRSDGDSSYLVSLDFPFRGFHGLWICYDSIGWNVLSRSIVPGTEAKWPVVQLELENKQSGRAYVWFSFFDQQGKPLRITEATLSGGARERVASNILQRLSNDEALSEPVTFQCQLMFESGIELTESQRQEFAGILIQAMSQLRDATIPLVSEL